jgi:NAD(P)-dependent dehydrogenase (short-subunit alcohol dehydrogenase family)
VTGGLGQIGLAVAERLAQSIHARLVLVGRATPPARDAWASWVQSHPADDRISRQIAAVGRLEQLGSEVLIVAADVTDVVQMRRAVDEACVRFGTVHGVIHAAGIVRGTGVDPIEALTPEACEQQFAPKVAGVYALEQATAHLALDFCLLTSSLSSVLGGLGYGAYAAANQFLDSFADQHADGRVRWISVNLDSWKFDSGGGRTGVGNLEMSATEGVEALVRTLAAGGTTRMAVSTADLTARIDKYVSQAAEGGSKAETAPAADTGHSRPQISVDYAEPTNELEQAICEVWQQLLRLERVGIHDDFFELGGHSLLATQLASRLRQTFEIDLRLADLFEAPTVAALAELFMTRLLEAEARDVAGQP